MDTKSIRELITSLQVEKNIYYDGETMITEEGINVNICEKEINWNSVGSLTLGKIGELYAQYILRQFGCTTYEALVDDHGVDLIAKYGDKYFKIQVKTIRNNNYTFVRKDNPIIDEIFFVFYIRVSEEGIPMAYLFPMKKIVDRLGNKKGSKYMCFSYHDYLNCPSEYGISAASKFFDDNGSSLTDECSTYYLIAEGWDFNKKQFEKIVN